MGQVVTAIAPVIAAELPGLIQTVLPPLLAAAGDILTALGQGLIAALPTLAPIAADLIIQLVTFVIDNLPLVIDSAIQIILAVVEGLTVAMPQLIPAAADAVITIVMALIDNIDLLVNASLQLIIALADGLIQALPELIAAVPQIVGALVSELASMTQPFVDAALGWGADIISGLVQGIQNGISMVEGAVSSVASSIRDFIGFSEPERGPLSDFHTYMPDMYDMLEEGIEEGAPEFEATLNRSLAMPSLAAPGMVNEYTPDGDVNGGNIVIPVNIGQERLDTIMIRSSQIAQYRRGG
jgi:hypothetical protein